MYAGAGVSNLNHFRIKCLYLHQEYQAMHHMSMRTTVTLSEEAAELVTLYADAQGISRSRAVSDLVVQGGRRESRIKLVSGIPVFDLPDYGKQTTFEDVKRIESESY
jgi:hypothetical protein